MLLHEPDEIPDNMPNFFIPERTFMVRGNLYCVAAHSRLNLIKFNGFNAQNPEAMPSFKIMTTAPLEDEIDEKMRHIATAVYRENSIFFTGLVGQFDHRGKH